MSVQNPKDSLKIIHLTVDSRGGAGAAVKAIARDTQSETLISKIMYLDEVLKPWIFLRFFYHLKARVKTILKKILPVTPSTPFEKVSGIKYPSKLTWDRLPKHDVLHLHWVNGMFSWRSFFDSIPDSFPIVWTMHDFYPGTGGCHVPFDCDHFTQTCQDCPAVRSKSKIEEFFKIKIEVLRKKNIHFVASSLPMARFLGESRITQNHPRTVIPLWTHSVAASQKRKQKPKNRDLVLGFLASGIQRKNKGLGLLVEATKDHSNITLLVAGPGAVASHLRPSNIRFLGELKTSKELDAFFEKIDFLVIPSFYESFGLSALESIDRNVPIIASDTGVHSELLENPSHGILFNPGDLEGLRRALLRAQSEKFEFDSHEYIQDLKKNAIKAYSELYFRVANGARDLG